MVGCFSSVEVAHQSIQTDRTGHRRVNDVPLTVAYDNVQAEKSETRNTRRSQPTFETAACPDARDSRI